CRRTSTTSPGSPPSCAWRTSLPSPRYRWRWRSQPPSIRRGAQRERRRQRHCGMNEERQPESVLRATGLAKTYAEGSLRTPVFDGLDIEVHAGETVAILGASGAGKSTLLHLLGGLETPTAGEVYVAGQKMSALSDAARGKLRNRALGFVYQFHHLLPEFTALENVMLPVLLGGTQVPEAAARARELLESVGLGHRLGH